MRSASLNGSLLQHRVYGKLGRRLRDRDPRHLSRVDRRVPRMSGNVPEYTADQATGVPFRYYAQLKLAGEAEL